MDAPRDSRANDDAVDFVRTATRFIATDPSDTETIAQLSAVMCGLGHFADATRQRLDTWAIEGLAIREQLQGLEHARVLAGVHMRAALNERGFHDLAEAIPTYPARTSS
jgi:hypothetical protein